MLSQYIDWIRRYSKYASLPIKSINLKNILNKLFHLQEVEMTFNLVKNVYRHVSWYYQTFFHSTLEGRGHLKMAKAQNFRSLKSCPSNMWGNICTFAFPLEKILFSIKKNSLWFRNSVGKKLPFLLEKKITFNLEKTAFFFRKVVFTFSNLNKKNPSPDLKWPHEFWNDPMSQMTPWDKSIWNDPMSQKPKWPHGSWGRWYSVHNNKSSEIWRTMKK